MQALAVLRRVSSTLRPELPSIVIGGSVLTREVTAHMSWITMRGASVIESYPHPSLLIGDVSVLVACGSVLTADVSMLFDEMRSLMAHDCAVARRVSVDRSHVSMLASCGSNDLTEMCELQVPDCSFMQEGRTLVAFESMLLGQMSMHSGKISTHDARLAPLVRVSSPRIREMAQLSPRVGVVKDVRRCPSRSASLLRDIERLEHRPRRERRIYLLQGEQVILDRERPLGHATAEC